MPWLRNKANLAARAGSLVNAIPPSPAVMTFTGWKLSTVMSDHLQLPTGSPCADAPIACEASSMIRKP